MIIVILIIVFLINIGAMLKNFQERNFEYACYSAFSSGFILAIILMFYAYI